MIIIIPLLLSLFFSIFQDEEKIISLYSLYLIFIFQFFISFQGLNTLHIVVIILLIYWLISTHINNINLFTLYLVIASFFIFYSNSLYGYFLSVELTSFIIMVFINLFLLHKRPGILYFLFSSLFSALFILSCGYLSMGYYISYSFITLVFLWKLNLVPFHYLMPSIYNNISPKLIFFIDIPSKILLFFLFYRIILSIPINLYFFIFLSIFIGTIAALIDKNLINILIYSSLTNYGLILILIQDNNWNSFVFYIIFYSFMVLIYLFLIIFKSIDRTFFNYTYIFIWTLLLFNLIGIPPFVGFFIKLLPLYLLISNLSFFYTIIILLIFLILAYIYLKILASLLMNTKNQIFIYNNNFYLSHFISSLLILLAFPIFII